MKAARTRMVLCCLFRKSVDTSIEEYLDSLNSYPVREDIITIMENDYL